MQVCAIFIKATYFYIFVYYESVTINQSTADSDIFLNNK